MRPRASSLAFVGILALAALAPKASAAAPRERACLVDAAGTRGSALGRPLARALEAQLARAFQLSPAKAVERTAQGLRLERGARTSPPGLPRLVKALKCRVPLAAWLRPGLGEPALSLAALDAQTGAVRAEVGALTRNGTLGAAELRRLVEALVSSLREGPATETSNSPAGADLTARDGAGAVAPATVGVDGQPGATRSGGVEGPAGADRQAQASEGASGTPPADDPWAAATEGFGPTPSSAPGSAGGGAGATAVAPGASGGAGGGGGSGGGSGGDRLEAGGRVRVEHFAYFSRGPSDNLPGRQSVEAALRLAASHERVKAYASLLGRVDFGDPSRNRFEPDVAWVELRAPVVTFRAGRAVSAWGTANLYNPSDVVSAVDLRDPLATEKLGTLQLRALASLGPITLEAMYLPVPEFHRLPPIEGISSEGKLRSRSRWLRGSVDVTGSAPLTFHVSPFTPPPPSVSNGQGAARVTAAILGADISLGYAFLLDRVPSPRLEAVPASGPPLGVDVYVDWRARRLHVLCADAERTFGKLRVALEGAAFLTADTRATDPNVVDPYWIANAGADLQTGAFAGDMRLHLFLEFVAAGALVGELPSEGLDLLRAPFPHSVLARIAWELSDSLRIEANAVSDVTRFDVFASLRVEAMFADRLKARLGVDLLAGDPDTGFFGPFRDNGRAVATVEASF